MPSSTLSSKCQITIPLEVRNRLGLKAGDRVEFTFEAGRTVLLPARPEENPFTQFIGSLPPLPDGKTSLAFWREMRGHDPKDEDDY
jgi:AbrB family looped-hinge helix DNA binding protein